MTLTSTQNRGSLLESKHTTYGFEAQEVKNPRLQTYHNSELKRGRYDWLKQGCAKSIAVQ